MITGGHGHAAEVIHNWLTSESDRPARRWGVRLLAAGFLTASLGACTSPPLLNLGLGLGVAGGVLARVPAHRLPGFFIALSLALWMLVCSLVNHSATTHFVYPGWAYTWPSLYVFAFAAADLRLRRSALLLLFVGGISAVLVGALQFFIGLDMSRAPLRISADGEHHAQAVGWFSHHIRFGIAMAQMAVVALAADSCGWGWRWRMLPAIFGIIGVALSSSRGALTALAGGIAVALVARGGRWIAIGIGGAVVVIGLGIIVSLIVQPDRSAQALQGQDVRWQVWRTTLMIIQDHPWFGVGPGGFDRAYTDIIAAGRSTIIDPWALSPGNAHNQFLSLASYYGIPGVALYVAWLIAVARDLWRSRAAPGVWPLACGTITVMLIGGLTEDLANYSTSRHGLFLMLGIACGLAADGFRQRRAQPLPHQGHRDSPS